MADDYVPELTPIPSLDPGPHSEAILLGTPPSREIWMARGAVVLAAVLWSMSGFFAKAPIFDDWPVDSRGILLAFWRAVFAALALLPFVRKIRWSWKLLPATACFVIMNWAYLNALVYNEATLAIWLQYSAPLWVFLGGWMLFGERPVRRDYLLLLFTVCGLGVILSNLLSGASPAGIGYGVLAGVFFAAVMLSLRWCRDFDSAWIICWNHIATAVCFLPVVIQTEVFPTGSQFLYLFGFGAIQMGIPYILFARAVRSLPGHEASGLTLLEPILMPVWVWVAWGGHPDYQPPAVTTVIGGSLILAGLLIRYWPRRWNRRRAMG